jgi:hypothetical protein
MYSCSILLLASKLQKWMLSTPSLSELLLSCGVVPRAVHGQRPVDVEGEVVGEGRRHARRNQGGIERCRAP